jgi:hypothetical protein
MSLAQKIKKLSKFFSRKFAQILDDITNVMNDNFLAVKLLKFKEKKQL